MKRAAVRLGACLCCLLLTAGCSWVVDAREVSRLQLVQTLGYDGDAGGVTLSVSSGRGIAGEPPALLSAGGRSVADAARRLQDWSARDELFFSHVRYAVAGEAAARAGLAPLLDYFERSTQTPMSLPLFVVKGGSARELVTGSADPGYEVTALLSSLQRDAEQTGAAHCFSLLDVARRLLRSRAALCCAVTAAPPEGHVPLAEEGALSVQEAGYAVLKDGKLAGFLDADETLGADLLLELAGDALYVLPDGRGGAVTLALRSESAALTPERDASGALTLSVELRCRAGIVESSGGSPLDGDLFARLEAELAAETARQAEAALRRSRELNADFLELYRRMGKAAPARFPGVVGEDFLPALTWRVGAEASVERSYDIDSGAHAGEEAAHG